MLDIWEREKQGLSYAVKEIVVLGFRWPIINIIYIGLIWQAVLFSGLFDWCQGHYAGYSGSDLQALCEEAAMVPIRELGANILTVNANQVILAYIIIFFLYEIEKWRDKILNPKLSAPYLVYFSYCFLNIYTHR